MTDIQVSAAPASDAGGFNAAGRIVGPGRGWDWIVEAWALFRKQPGIWILLAVVLGVLFIAVDRIPVLGSLANALLFPIFIGGLMLGCRAQDGDGTLEFTHLFAGFKHRTGDLVLVGVFNLIGLAIIVLVVIATVGAGVLTAIAQGGPLGAGVSIVSLLLALLLFAALSIPLYMATWFAPALIVLNEMPPVAALKASFYACLKNWLPFLVYGVVLLVFAILAAIPVFLGYLVLLPVILASVYTAYRDIFCGATA